MFCVNFHVSMIVMTDNVFLNWTTNGYSQMVVEIKIDPYFKLILVKSNL